MFYQQKHPEKEKEAITSAKALLAACWSAHSTWKVRAQNKQKESEQQTPSVMVIETLRG